MRWILIALIVFSISCNITPQSTLDKIRALDLKTIENEITTYYPKGYEGRAEANLTLLQNSVDFFEDHFGVKQPFSLAVLDSVNWSKITRVPYGLPFVTGPPYVVCIPAGLDNDLSRSIASAIEGHQWDTEFGMSHEQIVSLFISLIGFHEIGHVYARAYGIHFPNKWTYEFAATYFAYFYLDQNFPEERDIWLGVSDVYLKGVAPDYTSIKDFEEKYSHVGIENYAWYQVVFLQQVQTLHGIKGKVFIEKLRDYQWSSSSTTAYLEEMNQIGPGFLEWAEKYDLQ